MLASLTPRPGSPRHQGGKVGSYLVRRFGLMVVTLFGISVIIFLMLRVAPGNIADILFDAAGFVDPTEKKAIMAQLGLDKPLVIQYLTWIGGLLHGDLGYSYVSDRPALAEILPRIPITARVGGLALTFAALIGVPLGVISAVSQNTRLDSFAAGLEPVRPVDAGLLAGIVGADGGGLAGSARSQSIPMRRRVFWPGSACTACRRRSSGSAARR